MVQVRDQSENQQDTTSQARQIPVVEEETVYEQPVAPQESVSVPDRQPTDAVASSPSSPEGKDVEQKKSRFPIKFIIIGLIGLIFAFGSFLLYKNVLQNSLKENNITLDYWGFENANVMDAVIKDFENLNPNVKINYIQQAQTDYRERLVNNLAKNAGPDVFQFHNSWVGMMSSYLFPAPSDIYSGTGFSNDFYPVIVSDLAYQGSPLGVPLEIDGLGLYVNEGLLLNSGKLVPNNWNDLRNTALELTNRDTEGRLIQSGVALGQTVNIENWQDILSLMLLQNKASLITPSGVLVEDPILYFTSFGKEFKTWDGSLPDSYEAFAKGQTVMFFGSYRYAKKVNEINPNLSFRVVPVPQLPKNSPDNPDITFASYWASGVWSKSSGRNEAWKFLQYLSQKNTLEKLNSLRTPIASVPYPRKDMANIQETESVTGAFVRQARFAQSSYLVSGTFDGSTGINSKMSVIWKTLLDQVIGGTGSTEDLLPQIAQSVQQVLDSYKITR